MQRPRVSPALRPVWRDATTLQLGLTPSHGVVLAGLQEGDDVLIEAMDGLRDVPSLRSLARSLGVAAQRVDDLLTVLSQAEVVTDAEREAPADAGPRRADVARLTADRREQLAGDVVVWPTVRPGCTDGLGLVAARTRRAVLVDGAGPVAETTAATLTAAGVGTVTREPTAATPDLHVLVREDVVDVCEADDLLAADRPHLAVVMTGQRVVVGPLVVPGRSACLRCLDLHRTDRDPAWPHVVAQLARRRAGGVTRVETASATMAGGLAALQVLAHLDGHGVPATLGRTLEVVLPDGLVERRRWPPHPSCGCQQLPAPGRRTTAGSGAPLRPTAP